jgi:hypothetical protein
MAGEYGSGAPGALSWKCLNSSETILCAALLLTFLGPAHAAAGPVKAPKIDIADVVQQSAKVTEADRKANLQFDCNEKIWQPDGSYKTYAVYMLYGSPYNELIAVNGKPLSKAEAQEQQKKLQQEISKRQHEPPQQRAQRVAEYAKEQDRDRHFIADFVQAFNFKLIGQGKLEGRPVYIVQATPRRDYRPPDSDAAALKGMEGRLWIDKATHQWVKAEAHVVHPVSIHGFVATVEPGTDFILEKRSVAPGVWLPKHFTMTAKAKIFGLFDHKRHEDVTFFNYHKATQPAD